MIELWEKSKHPREVVIGFVEHKVSELRDCSGELSTPSAGFPDSSFCPNCRRLIASGP
jgi:hypothetical protein